MIDRPEKLPPCALLVFWGATRLTLAETIICYHDWALDQGGADGAYASHASMSARLGGKLTEATVSKVRQRLKRLTLHEPIRRPNARNLGWVTTLPRHLIPRSHREAPALAAALDAYLSSLAAWVDQASRDGPESLDPTVQPEQTGESNSLATGLGGRGETSALVPVRQAQLPSAFREKRASARAQNFKKRDDPQAAAAFKASLERDVELGHLTQPQADRLLKVSGL